MDERTGNYVGVQLLENKQREELKSKWKSWFERKISSEMDKDEKSKWKQLLATNRFSYPKADYPGSGTKTNEQNGEISNDYLSENNSGSDIPGTQFPANIPLSGSSPDVIHLDSTVVPDIVPNGVGSNGCSNDDIEMKLENDNTDYTHVNERVDITNPEFWIVPNHVKETTSNGHESVTKGNDSIIMSSNLRDAVAPTDSFQNIRKLRTASTDSNHTVYQPEWDNMSDFPNVGSIIASTVNEFKDSISRSSDNTILPNTNEDPRSEDSRSNPYYCPYPPKVPRNNPYQPEFSGVNNELPLDYPVFDDIPSQTNYQTSPDMEIRHSRTNSIGDFSRTNSVANISRVNSVGNFSRVNSVGNLSRANSIGNFSRKSMASQPRKSSLRSTNPTFNSEEKANISEHQYDDFPAVSKSKWTDLLTMDSWKIGARLLRGSAYNSTRSSIAPGSECSTEGRCRINGTVNSIDRNFLKVNPSILFSFLPYCLLFFFL